MTLKHHFQKKPQSSIMPKDPNYTTTARRARKSVQKLSNRKISDFMTKEVVKDIDISKCVLCGKAIEYEETRKHQDILYHYTLDLFQQNWFEKLYPAKNSDPLVKEYVCPRKHCSRRPLDYEDFIVHMGVVHEVTKHILSETAESIEGMGRVVDQLYPPVVKMHEKSTKKLSHEKQVDVSTKEKIAPGISSPSVINKRPDTFETHFTTDDVDEEYFDDPEWVVEDEDDVKETKIETEKKNIVIEDDDQVMTPNYSRVYNCVICGGQGKNNKEGRNMNIKEKLHDAKYHYAVCYYGEMKLLQYINPGPNKDSSGLPLEDVGTRFKYTCPFINCPKNSGGMGSVKNSGMGYKEYSIHIAVNHHVLETVMKDDSRAGVEEVRAAIVLERRNKKIVLEAMGEVVCEEVHTCRVCKGDQKEGKNLSFEPSKIASLRYHYAACFYDTGVYLTKYPPGPQNTDDKGQPVDELGKSIKYNCDTQGCSNKRRMGYKEYCIHQSSEHRGILSVMREHSDPEIRGLADRVESSYKKSYKLNNFLKIS